MLTGKTALVSGGSRGIGAAIAQKLVELGANVAILYGGNHEAAQKTCARLEEFGTTVQAYPCAVEDFAAVKATVAQIRKDFGGLDILVNNAGITKDGITAMMPLEDFDSVLDVDLKGAFYLIRQCIPLFLRRKGGAIVNITSVSGMKGNAGQANYSAAKAGLIGLTKSVARELAGKGITCNAVAPGFIETDMTAELPREQLQQAIPLGRMGSPEDVAEAVAFLCGQTYITGEVLRVDGGLAM